MGDRRKVVVRNCRLGKEPAGKDGDSQTRHRGMHDFVITFARVCCTSFTREARWSVSCNAPDVLAVTMQRDRRPPTSHERVWALTSLRLFGRV